MVNRLEDLWSWQGGAGVTRRIRRFVHRVLANVIFKIERREEKQQDEKSL